jgi:molybdopterin synthase catalytic subunit
VEESADIIRVTAEPLDVTALMQSVRLDSSGAVASFVGVVRDHHEGRRVHHLVYEAYAPMAEQELRDIAAQMRQRWQISRVALAHRTGRLEIGEASVAVVVAAPHRREALEACSFGIEQIKKTVPIWKKEFDDDAGEWVIGDPSAT